MANTKKLLVDPGWGEVLAQSGMRAADLLRRSGLPEDLFNRPRPIVETKHFQRLWDAMEDALGPTAALQIGARIGQGPCDPARLGVVCSADLTSGFQRLSQLRSLTGAQQVDVNATLGGLEVSVDAAPLPKGALLAELVGIMHLVRLGLGPDTKPVAVELKDPPLEPQFRDYFGRALRPGPFDRLVFTSELAKRPVAVPSADTFVGFPLDLRPRLDELPVEATTADRVCTVLMEAMPAGLADIATVAKRFAVSPRSLQRRLAVEGTSFKAEVQNLRARLARHYLRDTASSGTEIAFLLGFDDPNSFIRAFHDWTGTTPEAMRRTLLEEKR